jgi:hypothetical protein
MLRDLHASLRFRAELEQHPHRLTSEKEVTVVIPVSEFAEGRARVPLSGPAEGRPAVLLPDSVTVVYRAPLRRFKDIVPSDFAVGLRQGSGPVNRSAVVPLRVPDQAEVTAIEPFWAEYYYLN